MANDLVVQQKATSLRAFLFEDARKEAFAAALPKWLSVDRLLRVVFSSALRNPQILDCTKESILQAVMTCATLGIEPILGRGYLVPYRNNKLVAGKWEKVMECQFQPGHQGLVDLARRTDTIADVYGMNVYENDEFDIIYGTHRDIMHRPWFMDPKKRDVGPGEILGAYVVWLLKDGTQHPEFMHISDIHKRRNSSQAWRYASEHKDDQKAQSTPWLQWPEEMNLKTVVKHSSKLIPASIEFMTAIQIDDDVETHGKLTPGSLFNPNAPLDMGALESGGPDAAFADLTAEIDQALVDQFITGLVAHYKGQWTAQDIKAKALEDGEGFMAKLRDWIAKSTGTKTLKDEIGRLKTTGLKEWKQEHHVAIFNSLHQGSGEISADDLSFFQQKWKGVIGYDYMAKGQPGEKPEGGPEMLFPASGGVQAGTEGQGGMSGQGQAEVTARAAFVSEVAKYEEVLPRPAFVRVLRLKNVEILENTDPTKYEEILAAFKTELESQK